mgnify:CR=1 FL=1
MRVYEYVCELLCGSVSEYVSGYVGLCVCVSEVVCVCEYVCLLLYGTVSGYVTGCVGLCVGV